MSHELEHIWSRVQAQLALLVDESTYRIWLEPLRALELEQDTLLVEAPPDACGSAVRCPSIDTFLTEPGNGTFGSSFRSMAIVR